MAKDNKIEKLDDYGHTRLRTEMYFGSRASHTQDVIIYYAGEPRIESVTWTPALLCAFREVLDNALDETIGHGYGNRVDITYDEKKLEFSCRDYGRGIPIQWSDEHDMHLATMVLTHARAGRNFGAREQVVGTNGIGVSATNFCSKQFSVDIWRDKKHFHQVFNEGKDGQAIEKPAIRKNKNTTTGTMITFTPSKSVFKNGMLLPEKFLYSRIFDIALANPLIKFYWNGKQIRVRPIPEKTLFPGEKVLTIEIKENTFKSKFILKPQFVKSGEMVHTTVNNISAFNGGSHVDAFKRYFYSGLLAALESQSKRRKLTPNRNDINDGLFIYNITTMHAPDFDSQSKTRLINEDIVKIIKTHLEDEKFFKDTIKKNPEWIESIFEKCAARTQQKDARDVKREAKKILRGRVPDLLDAAGKDRQKCILILGEGNSAVAGIPPVRDPEIHAILGIQGKVMNVNGESPRRVLDSATLSSLMTTIGLVINEKAIRENLNYGKIYIATDADPDGLNIAALLTNFFYTYWPELFDKDKEPIFYVFNTPFIIARKGNQTKYWYSHNYQEFIPDEYKGWELTRAKGLAALEKNDWVYSLQNPDLYAIVDDGKMNESLDLIFNGSRSDDRKVWIGL